MAGQCGTTVGARSIDLLQMFGVIASMCGGWHFSDYRHRAHAVGIWRNLDRHFPEISRFGHFERLAGAADINGAPSIPWLSREYSQ